MRLCAESGVLLLEEVDLGSDVWGGTTSGECSAQLMNRVFELWGEKQNKGVGEIFKFRIRVLIAADYAEGWDWGVKI